MRKPLKCFFLLSFGAAALLAAPPAFAKKSLWQMLFPYNSVPQQDAPDPTRTLHAPFAAETPAPAGTGALNQLYSTDFDIEGTGVGLEKPNRYHKEVGTWLVRALSEIFHLDATNYDAHIKHLATGMNPKALADFDSFSKAARIRETLSGGDLRMNAYVEEDPLLLNQGAVAGRYRWLFEVPVLLTFLPRTAISYKNHRPVSQRVLVTVQVGRMPRGQGVEDMMIESFAVRRNPAATPGQ